VDEAEWLACNDAQRLLWFLRGKVSDRKLILYAGACYRGRRMWSRLGKTRRREVYLMERAADDPAGGGWSVPTGTNTHEWAEWVLSIVRSRIRPNDNYTSPDKETLDWINDRIRAEHTYHRETLRCIAGNPFRPVRMEPAGRTVTVVGLAQAIYDERAFERMPVLADALKEAGCANADVLHHCDQPGVHVRGCWVVDLLLGKQ
jgi:hypothetical protein